MAIEINNESGAAADEVALMRLCRFVLDQLGIDPLAELSVVLLDRDAMAALHQQWMELPGPTDVMAFPMDGVAEPIGERIDPSSPGLGDGSGAEAMLGDVVLCPAVAAEQARTAGHSAFAELSLLATHGILHLLGYDHGDEDTEREMFAVQARVLADWVRATGAEVIKTPLPGTGGEVREVARASGDAPDQR